MWEGIPPFLVTRVLTDAPIFSHEYYLISDSCIDEPLDLLFDQPVVCTSIVVIEHDPNRNLVGYSLSRFLVEHVPKVALSGVLEVVVHVIELVAGFGWVVSISVESTSQTLTLLNLWVSSI